MTSALEWKLSTHAVNSKNGRKKRILLLIKKIKIPKTKITNFKHESQITWWLSVVEAKIQTLPSTALSQL